MKKKTFLRWGLPILIILAGLGIFGYLKIFAWNPERQKIAQINERSISVAQFNRELVKIPAPYQDIFREEPKQFLDQLILKEILLQEAEKRGVKSDANVRPEDMEMSIIQNLLKKEVLDKVKVSSEEIAEIYNQHKAQFGQKPLAEISPLIEELIREAKGKERVEEYIASLKDKAKIEISDKYLRAITALPPPTDTAEDFKKAIQSGKPLLVDFGANSCLPCRQIRPILKEIKQEYADKANVLVIDVYKFKELAREYKVQLIPTLIFFDKNGKEVFRHLGAWDKESIKNKLKEIGAA